MKCLCSVFNWVYVKKRWAHSVLFIFNTASHLHFGMVRTCFLPFVGKCGKNVPQFNAQGKWRSYFYKWQLRLMGIHGDHNYLYHVSQWWYKRLVWLKKHVLFSLWEPEMLAFSRVTIWLTLVGTHLYNFLMNVDIICILKAKYGMLLQIVYSRYCTHIVYSMDWGHGSHLPANANQSLN